MKAVGNRIGQQPNWADKILSVLHLKTTNVKYGGADDLKFRMSRKQADSLALETRKQWARNSLVRQRLHSKLEISAPVMGTFRIEKHFESASMPNDDDSHIDVRLLFLLYFLICVVFSNFNTVF